MNSFKKTYIRLLGYAKPYWTGFLVAAAAMVLTALSEVAFPALMRPFVDRGLAGKVLYPVWWVPLGIIGVFLVRAGTAYVSAYVINWIAHNVLRDLRNAMVEKLMRLPAAIHDRTPVGGVISKVITEVAGVTASISNVIITVIRDSLVLFGLFAWLLYLNWQLTLIVCGFLPVILWQTKWFTKRLRQISRESLARTADLTASVEQITSAQRTIRLFRTEQEELRRFHETNARYRLQAMKLVSRQSLQGPLSQLIAACAIAVIVTVILMQARDNTISVGNFVSYMTALLMMLSPMKHLSDVNAQIQRGLVAARSIFEFLDMPEESRGGSNAPNSIRGALRLDVVSFTHQGREKAALRDISLDIPAGLKVAIVGPSGSGKSSLLGLIPRLYEPDQGAIFLDNININEYPISHLRSHLILLSQDVYLFPGSIRRNLFMENLDIPESELTAVLEHVGLIDLIDSLPRGLDTEVGDRGAQLSGGQKQRIALARALLRRPKVLLLDEATSALDNNSESMVWGALKTKYSDMTLISVLHRLSIVDEFDKIYVLDSGQVVESGQHRELMERKGVYAALQRTGSLI